MADDVSADEDSVKPDENGDVDMEKSDKGDTEKSGQKQEAGSAEVRI